MKLSPSGPKGITQRRGKGSRAKGHSFDKRFGLTLATWAKSNGWEFCSHVWIEFWDDAGHGWAQPDYFLLRGESIILLECKLTQTEVAWGQMRELYVPLLEKLYSRPIICVQVCHNLRLNDGTIIESLSELADGKTLHWLR